MPILASFTPFFAHVKQALGQLRLSFHGLDVSKTINRIEMELGVMHQEAGKSVYCLNRLSRYSRWPPWQSS